MTAVMNIKCFPAGNYIHVRVLLTSGKFGKNFIARSSNQKKYCCTPNGAIKGDEWWRLQWIPFCGDGGGNHLCLDMDPPAGGTKGQIITMWHDTDGRDIVGKSLTDFISIIAGDIEKGNLVWNEDWGGIYEPFD